MFDYWYHSLCAWKWFPGLTTGLLISHIVMTHCLYLMALCGLRVGWTSFIVGTSGFSVLVVVNVFCTCKPLGGAGVFCLVPKVTSFHPSSSEFMLTSTMGTTLSGSFMQLGSQAFQAITEKILFIYISFSLNTVQPAFFLWVIFLPNSVASPKWHILCRTGLSFLASERGLRDLEGRICHLKLCLC